MLQTLLFDNNAFVCHGWNVSASGSARPHDDSNLSDAPRGQGCLVVEYPAKVVAVREHL